MHPVFKRCAFILKSGTVVYLHSDYPVTSVIKYSGELAAQRQTKTIIRNLTEHGSE